MSRSKYHPDDDDEEPISDKSGRSHRRWRRQTQQKEDQLDGCCRIRGAARKARTSEWRLGQRSWWPPFGFAKKYRVAVLSSPPQTRLRTDNDGSYPLLRKWSPSDEHGSAEHGRKQIEPIDLDRKFHLDECKKSTQYRDKGWKIFHVELCKRKEKVMLVKPGNDVQILLRTDDDTSLREERSYHHPENEKSSLPLVEKKMIESNNEQNERKNKQRNIVNPAVVAVTSVVLANVGVAVAIILL